MMRLVFGFLCFTMVQSINMFLPYEDDGLLSSGNRLRDHNGVEIDANREQAHRLEERYLNTAMLLEQKLDPYHRFDRLDDLLQVARMIGQQAEHSINSWSDVQQMLAVGTPQSACEQFSELKSRQTEAIELFLTNHNFEGVDIVDTIVDIYGATAQFQDPESYDFAATLKGLAIDNWFGSQKRAINVINVLAKPELISRLLIELDKELVHSFVNDHGFLTEIRNLKALYSDTLILPTEGYFLDRREAVRKMYLGQIVHDQDTHLGVSSRTNHNCLISSLVQWLTKKWLENMSEEELVAHDALIQEIKQAAVDSPTIPVTKVNDLMDADDTIVKFVIAQIQEKLASYPEWTIQRNMAEPISVHFAFSVGPPRTTRVNEEAGGDVQNCIIHHSAAHYTIARPATGDESVNREARNRAKQEIARKLQAQIARDEAYAHSLSHSGSLPRLEVRPPSKPRGQRVGRQMLTVAAATAVPWLGWQMWRHWLGC